MTPSARPATMNDDARKAETGRTATPGAPAPEAAGRAPAGRSVSSVLADETREAEARARRLARRNARLAKGAAPWQREGPPSPCVKVCRFEEAGRWCAGCFRTAAEIRDWPILEPAARKAVLARLPARRNASSP